MTIRIFTRKAAQRADITASSLLAVADNPENPYIRAVAFGAVINDPLVSEHIKREIRQAHKETLAEIENRETREAR